MTEIEIPAPTTSPDGLGYAVPARYMEAFDEGERFPIMTFAPSINYELTVVGPDDGAVHFFCAVELLQAVLLAARTVDPEGVKQLLRAEEGLEA